MQQDKEAVSVTWRHRVRWWEAGRVASGWRGDERFIAKARLLLGETVYRPNKRHSPCRRRRKEGWEEETRKEGTGYACSGSGGNGLARMGLDENANVAAECASQCCSLPNH